MFVTTLFVAMGFAAIHIWVGHLHLVSVLPRSVWLSMAGGVAVAYVFLHILPDLAAHRQSFAEGLGVGDRLGETLVFLVALAGLTVFYGLERLVLVARGRVTEGGDIADRIFWTHLGSFAAYNVLIGYLLVERGKAGASALALYAFAIGTHFLTADFGLRNHHDRRYDRLGRWILAAAVLSGWAVAQMVDLPPLAIGFLFALLAGSAILNVLKEELPEDRQSRFWAFLLGAAGYSAILLAV